MFSKKIADRSVEEYADFFLPLCPTKGKLADIGCGDGTITVGLADHCEQVLGFDVEDQFTDAQQYLDSKKVQNVEFEVASAYELPLADESIDAVFCHSILEALQQPDRALREAWRVLKNGAWLGVASVEYQGLILHGGDSALLEKFYNLRKSLWVQEGVANPYFGRTLKGQLSALGFVEVQATTKCISHGTRASVEAFGLARRDECSHRFYREKGVAYELTDPNELDAMADAWEQWAYADEAYCSFSFCRAVGRKPG